MILELFQIFKKKLPQSNVCQFDLFSCWLKCKMGSFLHFLNHTPKIICSNFRPTVFMANLRYRIFDNISFNNPHNNPHFKFQISFKNQKDSIVFFIDHDRHSNGRDVLLGIFYFKLKIFSTYIVKVFVTKVSGYPTASGLTLQITQLTKISYKGLYFYKDISPGNRAFLEAKIIVHSPKGNSYEKCRVLHIMVRHN